MPGDDIPMTAAVPVWAPAERPSSTNLAGRIVATSVMLFGGLVLVAGAIGLSVALGMIERGAIVANAADVATARAIAPTIPLIVVFGAAHLIAGLGAIIGSKRAMQLSLGLAAVDVVAGILVMFATALSEKPALDGAAIGVTIIVLGTILFAAVRAATYDPSTDPAAAG
jgi:hypothetical protein